MDLMVVAMTLTKFGFEIAPIIAATIRSTLTVVLFVAIWKGHSWARWLMVTLCSIGLVFGIFAAVATPHPLTIAIAVQFLITVSLLTFPPGVRRFQTDQRER
jgi:hypothetical protein